MTHPQNQSVIYLPPGVMPASAQLPANTGIPFNRQFFEGILPQTVQSFCNQVECNNPRVELYTADGTTHYVNGISGVTDLWVALQTTREDHEHTIQVFVPYQTIYRVEIHPESDESRRHLGYLLPNTVTVPPAVQVASPAPKAARVTKPKVASKK
jgi:hypothetical protein